MIPRFHRQSFLGANSDEVLHSSRVGIVGLGGGGSHIAQQLAHIGIGNFALFDPDKIEDTNLNRLVGGTMRDVKATTLKTAIARRSVKRVNPDATIVCVSEPWQTHADLLAECDAVIGSVDTYATRDELERCARRHLIPYIDIGMDVTEDEDDGFVISGQVILSMPGEPCMRCLGFLNEKVLAEEAGHYGAAGGRPQVVWPNGLLASAAVGILVQLLTPWQRRHSPLCDLEYDGNRQILQPSNRLQYLPSACPHFSEAGHLGDPFWGTH